MSLAWELVNLTFNSFALCTNCFLNNEGVGLPDSHGDVLGNLSSELGVVHQKEFYVLGRPDQQLLESGGQQVPGLLGRGHTDFWHSLVSSELPSDSRVNTMGLSPGGLKE